MNAAEIEELLIKLVQIPAPTGRNRKGQNTLQTG